MAEVTFDYQNLVEVEGGLQGGELDEIQPRLRGATDELLGDPPGFMRLPKTEEYAEASVRVAEEIRTSGATDFIHVGIGGSALGPMALHKALSHPYYNAVPGEARRRLASLPARRAHGVARGAVPDERVGIVVVLLARAHHVALQRAAALDLARPG